jgi:hypothetical protein
MRRALNLRPNFLMICDLRKKKTGVEGILGENGRMRMTTRTETEAKLDALSREYAASNKAKSSANPRFIKWRKKQRKPKKPKASLALIAKRWSEA